MDLIIQQMAKKALDFLEDFKRNPEKADYSDGIEALAPFIRLDKLAVPNKTRIRDIFLDQDKVETYLDSREAQLQDAVSIYLESREKDNLMQYCEQITAPLAEPTKTTITVKDGKYKYDCNILEWDEFGVIQLEDFIGDNKLDSYLPDFKPGNKKWIVEVKLLDDIYWHSYEPGKSINDLTVLSFGEMSAVLEDMRTRSIDI